MPRLDPKKIKWELLPFAFVLSAWLYDSDFGTWLEYSPYPKDCGVRGTSADLVPAFDSLSAVCREWAHACIEHGPRGDDPVVRPAVPVK